MKKVLIITYYWPPAGGPGVQRWLKFVKYLPDFGIKPIVYCPENPNYPVTDPSMLSEVSSKLEVLRTPIREPYRWAQLLSKSKTNRLSKGLISNENKQTIIERLLLFIRGNFFIPDARVSWVQPSVSYLSKYIKTHKIDTIISTGPPHSLHLIGLQLKQIHSLKWIADFRDPWTHIGYHKKLMLTSLSQKKHKKHEAAVFKGADRLIVTSPQTKAVVSKRTTTPVSVISNGYDFEITKSSSLDSKFSLSHIGSLLEGRNPHMLWKVLSDLVNESKLFSDSFELNLIGNVSEAVLESIQVSGLQNHVHQLGYVSHNKALEHQKRSQMLLLIEENSKETQYIIPAKLFEYMASKRPIIAVGPPISDIEEILNESKSGSYFRYNEAELMRRYLLKCFDAYLADCLKVASKDLENYSRKSLTSKLTKIIVD